MTTPVPCRRLLVSGRVQGVGYRAWLAREAGALGLRGWVRNRRDGTVEGEFAGEEGALAALAARCRSGPPAAAVADVSARPCSGEPLPAASVEIRPTV